MASIYEEIVGSLDELTGGPHEGLRAVHARGHALLGDVHSDPRGARD